MNKLLDMTGRIFGALRVVAFDHQDEKRRVFWACKCECGNRKVVRGDQLRAGKVTSCGCGRYRMSACRVTKRITKLKAEQRKEATIHSAVMDWLYSRSGAREQRRRAA